MGAAGGAGGQSSNYRHFGANDSPNEEIVISDEPAIAELCLAKIPSEARRRPDSEFGASSRGEIDGCDAIGR